MYTKFVYLSINKYKIWKKKNYELYQLYYICTCDMMYKINY